MNIKPEYKIIADHLRSSCFLIADGILPSNEGRGYVLRRIMRRSMRQIHKIGVKEPLMYKLVDALIDEMGSQYQELQTAKNLIIETLKNEEEKFQETLEKGLKILEEEIIIAKNLSQKKLSGIIAFKLYDTFGFPLDLTADICKEKSLEINYDEFNQQMEIQKNNARKNWIGSGETSESKLYFELKEKFLETQFCYHETTKTTSKILAICFNGKMINEISNNNHEILDAIKNDKNSSLFIILDKTPFYATSGGQKGDDGNLILASDNNYDSLINYKETKNIIDIYETKKFAGNLFVHLINDIKGSFKIGDEIIAIVNVRHRQLRAQNHSATHLLHKALKNVLGNFITQKGSNVDVKQLTFDFNFNRSVNPDEIEQIEELVNFYIRQNSIVNTDEMELDEAKKSGAEALFGEKYDQQVRVVSMGPSVELCGGTHVKMTGNIGLFKIINENSVASGIRRITAKTGFYALQHLKLQESKLYYLLNSLKVKQQFDDIKINDNDFLSNKTGFDDLIYFDDENSDKIINLSQKNYFHESLLKTAKIGEDINNIIKEKDKVINNYKKQILQQHLAKIDNQKINNFNFASYIFPDIDAKDLREITCEAKLKEGFNKNQILIFFALQDNKANICLSLSQDINSNLDAVKLLNEIISKNNGKNVGGKKDLAMSGGLDPKIINNIIFDLKEIFIKT